MDLPFGHIDMNAGGARPNLKGPFHVDLNITNACPLRCRYCHAASALALREELTTDEWEIVLRGCASIGVRSISFAGGEPFERADFVDLVNAATALSDWDISIIASGASGHAVLPRLEHCRDRIFFSLSVDHPDAGGFNRMRIPGPGVPPDYPFRAACAMAEALTAGGFKWSANMVLTRENSSLVERNYTFVIDELGAAGLLLLIIAPAGRARASMGHYGLSYAEWQETFMRLTRTKMRGGLPRLHLSTVSPWEFYLPMANSGVELDSIENYWRYRSPLRGSRADIFGGSSDTSGISELAVDAVGNVYPSVLLAGDRRAICGNMRLQSLEDIWNTSQLLAAFRSQRRLEGFKECNVCSIRNICGGGSKVRSFLTYGSVDSPDPSCPAVDKALTRHVHWQA